MAPIVFGLPLVIALAVVRFADAMSVDTATARRDLAAHENQLQRERWPLRRFGLARVTAQEPERHERA